MSEETPNQSEARLQRHAKERRAQGGDFAMHPATRRMLQGEVARTLGGKNAAAKSRGWFAWLNSWSGRIAVGATAVVVVLTGSWMIWNDRLDQRAMQLARADMPMRKSAWAGPEGSKGVRLPENEVLLSAAPAGRAKVDSLMLPASPTVSPITTTPALQSVSDSGKTAVDRLANNNAALAFQEQSTSYFANETKLSLAPVMQNSALFDTPPDAPKPELRSAQSFNYANAAGQNLTLPADGSTASSDRYGNQGRADQGGARSGRFAGGAYADVATKQMADKEEAAATSLGSQIARSNETLSQDGNRARFFRSTAPASAGAAAVSAPVNQAPPAEPQLRGGEALRGAVVASGASAASGDAAASRNSSLKAGLSDALKSTSPGPFGRALAEPSHVLNDFAIEQRGSTVRVVDGDGSVYDGTVETPPSAGFVPGQGSGDGPVREVIPGTRTETAPRHQELSFRASGSNVTLRQIVVVNGRFTPGTETVRAKPAEAPSKLQDLARGASPSLPPSSNLFGGQYRASTNVVSTIEGTIRIGTTNQQWFRATRLP